MPTNKSPQAQQAVIAKRLRGDSKRQIARDLGMGRNTVGRILSESHGPPEPLTGELLFHL